MFIDSGDIYVRRAPVDETDVQDQNNSKHQAAR